MSAASNFFFFSIYFIEISKTAFSVVITIFLFCNFKFYHNGVIYRRCSKFNKINKIKMAIIKLFSFEGNLLFYL